MDFSQYIRDLLFEQDCVILPGLGGFVANYKPAEFDHANNTVNPPSKHILFNRNLVHNDGLLYAYVSEASGYGYKDVQDLTQEFIEGIRRDTRKGVKFVIEGLGYFFLDHEKQVQFTEEGGSNFLLDSYGLPFLQYREVEKYPRAETYQAATVETDPMARQRRIRRWAYGTAAACLLAAVIIVPVRNGYFNQAGIDLPVIDSSRKNPATQIENPVKSEAMKSSARISKARIIPAMKTENAQKIILPEPQYDIVVGSFKDFGNARQLRNQLVEMGYEARILSTEKDFFRVSAGTYSQQVEAKSLLTRIRDEYESSWILSN